MPVRRRLSAALMVLAAPLALADTPGKVQPMDPKALQAWMAAAAPAAGHQKLQDYVGSWTTHQTDWMPTGTKWNEADGTATCRLILGGRFVQEDYATTLDGHPLHGLGLTGFDRQKNAYVSLWMDNFGTGFVSLEGGFDGTGHVLTLLGAPEGAGVEGRPAVGWRVTDTWWDKNHHAMAWWGQAADGRPVKLSEILYTRNL